MSIVATLAVLAAQGVVAQPAPNGVEKPQQEDAPVDYPAAVLAAERPEPRVDQLPEAVKELLFAAMRAGDDASVEAIARMAHTTYPGGGAELDELMARWNGDRKARGETLLALADVPIVVPAGRLRAVELDPVNPRIWTGRGELGGFRSTGSTSELGMMGALTVNYRIGRWQHVMKGALDYRRSNGQVSQENWLLSYEPRFQLDPDMFFYGLAQYEHAPFVGYDQRYTVSAGLGAVLLKENGVNLRVTAGPAYRRVDYVLGEDESRLGARAAMDVDWRLAPHVRFTQTASSYVEQGTVTLGVNSGITTQIATRLASRISYNVQMEHTGALGEARYIRRLDTTSRVSLVYDF